MKKSTLLSLLGLGSLLVLCDRASACGPHYFPHGWYVPSGSPWARWWCYREQWVPPSATIWGPNCPQQCPNWYPQANGPMVVMQAPCYLPPRPCGYKNRHVPGCNELDQVESPYTEQRCKKWCDKERCKTVTVGRSPCGYPR